MYEDVIRLAVVGRLIRRRWPLLVVVAVLGALVGAAASPVVSPGYASTSRVLLQGEWDKTDLATQVLIATSTSVLDRVADTTDAAASGADLRDSITSALGEGKVVEITATADTPELAQLLADRATQEYVIFGAKLVDTARSARQQVVDSRRERLTADLEQRRERIRELEDLPPRTPPDVRARAGADIARELSEAAQIENVLAGQDANSSLEEAKSALRELNVVILEPASLPEDAAAPSRTQVTIGGAALFVLLGVFAWLAAASRDQRLRREPDIEAALGARLVGNVDVAVPAPSTADWGTRMRRLVRDDVPWDAPAVPALPDGPELDVRYRRLVERLRRDVDAHLRLLVLVDDHDVAARQAVARLALAAGDRAGPAVVVTDSAALTEELRAHCSAEADSDEAEPCVPVEILTGDEPVVGHRRTVLRVVETSAARPDVPDGLDVSGVLVVLTSGTRTGWELARLSETCADAGLAVLGALVTHRATAPKRKPDRATGEPTPGEDESTSEPPAEDTAGHCAEDTAEHGPTHSPNDPEVVST